MFSLLPPPLPIRRRVTHPPPTPTPPHAMACVGRPKDRAKARLPGPPRTREACSGQIESPDLPAWHPRPWNTQKSPRGHVGKDLISHHWPMPDPPTTLGQPARQAVPPSTFSPWPGLGAGVWPSPFSFRPGRIPPLSRSWCSFSPFGGPCRVRGLRVIALPTHATHPSTLQSCAWPPASGARAPGGPCGALQALASASASKASVASVARKGRGALRDLGTGCPRPPSLCPPQQHAPPLTNLCPAAWPFPLVCTHMDSPHSPPPHPPQVVPFLCLPLRFASLPIVSPQSSTLPRTSRKEESRASPC